MRASDRVWAFDLVSNEWKLRHVIKTYRHEHNGKMVAATVAGEVIESTGHHPWWVVRGEELEGRPQPEHVPFNPDGYNGVERCVDAIDFRAGDVLLLRSGEQAAITELTVRHARLPVYNFQVEELHCYAVGHAQVLVHNNSFDTAYGRYVSKVDGYKHALDPAHVKAALREKGGEIVKLKPDGKTPYDHLLETRNAMNGLFDRIPLLKKYLTDPNLTPAQRAIIQEELSTASKMLDNAERILGELAGSVR